MQNQVKVPVEFKVKYAVTTDEGGIGMLRLSCGTVNVWAMLSEDTFVTVSHPLMLMPEAPWEELTLSLLTTFMTLFCVPETFAY